MTQYLAFDIGGTNLKYALMSKAGKILEKGKLPTKTHDLASFMADMYQIGDQYKGKFAGIAVCAPGKIDIEKMIIHFGGALPFLDGLNLKDTLGKRYNVPISVENDGKAAALCEQWLGNLQNVTAGAVMTLGTCVGGGIVIGHQVLHGRDFQAGELSWMIINQSAGLENMDAYTCNLCSAVKRIKTINQKIGNKDLNDGKAAFAAIKAGNPIALKIFKQFCSNIAIMILNLQTVINGEKVVIGGGISAQPILIEEIRKQFANILKVNEVVGKQLLAPEIVAAKYKNDTNLYGALYALLVNMDKIK